MAGLATTESGGSATFTIALASQPTESVTISLASSLPTEGTVSPQTISLTPDNFDIPVTVTITGVDDPVDDGDRTYMVNIDAGTSGQLDLPVTNEDDDDVGTTIAPTSGLMTTEGGGTVTFSVKLDTQPSANVTIPITSGDTTEGIVAPMQLVFTPTNYNAPQTVTVTGRDDDLADGPQPYAINVGVATSTDTTYNGFDSADVSLTNIDNDTAGIIVTPTTGLVTTEAGGTATFTVVLASMPTANVTVPLSSSDLTEGTVAPSTVSFTPANWNAPQTVTITGVNDFVADGTQSYTIVTAAAVSADTGYSGRDAADVAVTNLDNETAGFTVTPTNGLQTTEAGGTATFTVVLNSQPTDDVTITLTSSDLTEGTVAPAQLTFTSTNWNVPQTVTVTGADDLITDGNQPYTITTGTAVSADASYAGANPADVSVTNLDDETAGFTVTPTSGLQTTEAGGTATFTVVLNSQPTADVTISLTSSDLTEGTVSPAQLTFTAANWNAPQTVTITGVDDVTTDGNQPYTITTGTAVSTDPSYAGVNPADVSVTNVDDETAGFTVTPTSGLQTTEAGGTATFTVVLNSQPTADVTITLTSSDLTEGTVSPAQLTFTAANWNAPQTVTITGADDVTTDGNQPYTITTGAAVSTDASYAGLDPADVSVTNVDDETAGFTVTPTSGLQTTEAGGTATFTVVLNSQPSANVTITLTSSDLTEGTVSPAQLTFTAANFSTPQTVTVTGVNDGIADGNQPYTITTGAAVSTDASYANLDPADVSVTNLDNETAGFTVTPTSGLQTTEAGGTATFTVVLNSQPTADVTITLTSSDPTEGTVSPAQLTFTSLNWNAPQTVTITGADDVTTDGNQPYTITTGAALSTDPSYANLDPADVSVTNVDDETAGFTVTPTSGLQTTEAGGTATFTVVLNSQPTADVTITLTSSDLTEGTVSPAQLTFTSLDWNAPQTVTITGANDLTTDGNQPYTITTGAAVSTDPSYANLDPADVSVTNLDDETAGFTVTPTSGLQTTEAGGTATFTVVLNSQPSANVTISLTSSDLTEGTVSPAQLTFTSANFNTPQTVTVTGADDVTTDGNQPYTITTGAAVSTDPSYANLDPADVSVTNVDDETAGFTVTPTSGLQTTEAGGTATFTVVLNSQPTADVTITLTSSDFTEGTVSPTQLTFTSANFNTPQTVTITGVNDLLADGDQIYTITTGAALSSDADYAGLDPIDVSVTNLDND